MDTWTPKVGKIIAFMAVIMGVGLLFYILLGFRYCSRAPYKFSSRNLKFIAIIDLHPPAVFRYSPCKCNMIPMRWCVRCLPPPL